MNNRNPYILNNLSSPVKNNNPYQSNNPFGNFNPITSTSMNNQSQNNFNKAYQTNQPMIEKGDFRNKNDIIHNNINDNLLTEFITDYQLYIESGDRSIMTYPSPYKFTVSLGGSSGSMKINKKNSNDDYVDGTPTPIIERRFKNVKFVRLDYVILPKWFGITYNEETDKYEFSSSDDYLMTKYRYLLLKIKELGSRKILSTNNKMTDDCFIIYPDRPVGTKGHLWLTSNGNKVFSNANLGNLERLTISLLNPKGEEICVLNSIDGSKINFKIIETENTDQSNALSDFSPDVDMFVSLIVGSVENEINTNTKFEY